WSSDVCSSDPVVSPGDLLGGSCRRCSTGHLVVGPALRGERDVELRPARAHRRVRRELFEFSGPFLQCRGRDCPALQFPHHESRHSRVPWGAWRTPEAPSGHCPPFLSPGAIFGLPIQSKYTGSVICRNRSVEDCNSTV